MVHGLGATPQPHTISVVVPVYRGETTLSGLVTEIEALTTVSLSPGGRPFVVSEVVLVHDNGPDRSDAVIRELVQQHPFVRAVWLSRNYGQHAATLAGMASTGSDWVATMDEDGQHDASYLPAMLDVAMESQAPLVYATPLNPPPHGPVRNLSSRTAKFVFTTLLNEGDATAFNSFRLVLGEVARSVAAYCGPGVYLDVALGWVVPRTATCPVRLRSEDRPSGYSYRRLLSHFWRLVITSGTRPLRMVTLLGVVMAGIGFLLALVLLVRRALNQITVAGWTSVVVALLVGLGMVLLALGVIAEYVGATTKMAMGRPLYLVTSDPASSPLGRDARGRLDPPPAT
jgi:polyisoprenyl-phosphate glycosyltransferase